MGMAHLTVRQDGAAYEPHESTVIDNTHLPWIRVAYPIMDGVHDVNFWLREDNPDLLYSCSRGGWINADQHQPPTVDGDKSDLMLLEVTHPSFHSIVTLGYGHTYRSVFTWLFAGGDPRIDFYHSDATVVGWRPAPRGHLYGKES